MATADAGVFLVTFAAFFAAVGIWSDREIPFVAPGPNYDNPKKAPTKKSPSRKLPKGKGKRKETETVVSVSPTPSQPPLANPQPASPHAPCGPFGCINMKLLVLELQLATRTLRYSCFRGKEYPALDDAQRDLLSKMSDELGNLAPQLKDAERKTAMHQYEEVEPHLKRIVAILSAAMEFVLQQVAPPRPTPRPGILTNSAVTSSSSTGHADGSPSRKDQAPVSDWSSSDDDYPLDRFICDGDGKGEVNKNIVAQLRGLNVPWINKHLDEDSDEALDP
ncbi:hypothetical protein N0V88_004950 [Collariella sp. IMI 366227]|nr:hypothetical protein N0V88_004950 [Collariella sp. IMI 366227]